jgi:hypothetical protein
MDAIDPDLQDLKVIEDDPKYCMKSDTEKYRLAQAVKMIRLAGATSK